MHELRSPKSLPAPPSAAASTRAWARVLSLWRLCDASSCRRTRTCRGDDPIACMARCMPLLPEGVVAWFSGLDACQQEGLSFDEALAELAEETEAFKSWCAAVEASLPKAFRSKPRRSAAPP